MRQLILDIVNAAGKVYIHDLRVNIGATGDRYEEFNRTVREMRHAKEIRVVALADLSIYTTEQIKHMIRGEGETFGLIKAV